MRNQQVREEAKQPQNPFNFGASASSTNNKNLTQNRPSQNQTAFTLGSNSNNNQSAFRFGGTGNQGTNQSRRAAGFSFVASPSQHNTTSSQNSFASNAFSANQPQTQSASFSFVPISMNQNQSQPIQPPNNTFGTLKTNIAAKSPESSAQPPVVQNELDEKLQKKLKNLKVNEVKIWLEQNMDKLDTKTRLQVIDSIHASDEKIAQRNYEKPIEELIQSCFYPKIKVKESDPYKIVCAFKKEHQKIYKQILSITCQISDQEINDAQKEVLGDLIVSLLDKLPLDQELSGGAQNQEEGQELKLMQLMNSFQHQMHYRTFKDLTNGKYEHDQNGCLKIIQEIYKLLKYNQEKKEKEKNQNDVQSLLKSFRESMVLESERNENEAAQINMASSLDDNESNMVQSSLNVDVGRDAAMENRRNPFLVSSQANMPSADDRQGVSRVMNDNMGTDLTSQSQSTLINPPQPRFQIQNVDFGFDRNSASASSSLPTQPQSQNSQELHSMSAFIHQN